MTESTEVAELRARIAELQAENVDQERIVVAQAETISKLREEIRGSRRVTAQEPIGEVAEVRGERTPDECWPLRPKIGIYPPPWRVFNSDSRE